MEMPCLSYELARPISTKHGLKRVIPRKDVPFSK